jgi:transposase-like protein
MKYCLRCGSKFSRIDSLKRHLKREKLCDPIYLDITPELINSEYQKYFKKIKESLVDKESCKNSFVCEDCSKSFTQKTNYYRHKQHYCKMKKNNISEIVDDLKKEIEELKSQLNNSQNITNNSHNNTNNTNNTNNGVINTGHIGNKIIINNYGEEKYNLTAKDCESIMSNDFNMVVKLIEKIHFDNEENRNIYMRSLKEKYAGIFIDEKWQPIEREKLIEELIYDKNLLLEKLLDEHGDNFTSVNPKRVKAIIDICRSDMEETKNVRSGVRKMMLIRNDDVSETYKDSYERKRIKFI